MKFTVCLNVEAYCSFERETTKEAVELTKNIINEDQLNENEVTLYFFNSDEAISLNEQNTQLETMVSQLNEMKTAENKEVVVNYLSDLFADMGYGAISQEIRYSRKAKDNALYGLKMYHSNLVGDRINPSTNEVYKVPAAQKETVNTFCNSLKSIIETYLDNGTDKQREYLKLKSEHDNAVYLFQESMFKLDNYREERDNDSMDKWKEMVKEYDKLDKLAKESKNKLDQFVLINLN